MIKNFLRFFIFYLSILSFSPSYCAKVNKINAIKNLAAYKILVCNKNKCTEIAAQTSKKLQEAFVVPFYSVKKYLKEFVKDTPFIAPNAIKISTNKGIFYIWRNESGIICAPDPKNPEAVMAWETKTLLAKNKNNQRVDISSLVLQINENGAFDIKQLAKEGHSASKI